MISKTKRSSPKFKGFFRPKSDTQGFFSAECRWSPIKKRSSPKFKGFFQPQLEIQRVFLAEIRWFQKKKGLHRLWVSSRTKKIHYSGPNNGKFFTTSAPKYLWWGLFSFLEQKSASKALKTCYFAYFLGQWGSSSSPHPPAGYATGRLSTTVIY